MAESLEAEQFTVEPPLLPAHCQLTVEPVAGKVTEDGEAVPVEQRVDPPGQTVVADE